jgi:uncharacterized protein (TIGR02466 family)
MTLPPTEVLARAEVKPLFPTPVFLARLKHPEPLNRELKDLILAREQIASGLDNSNVGGWHSGRDFTKWGGRPVERLMTAATRIADKITRDRQGRSARQSWRIEAWANVNRHGHANKRHTHPGCFWSGTYYVSVGEGIGGELGGEFQLHDPRGAALAGDPASEVRLDIDAPSRIRPEPGLFVFFPSWMPHSVRPFLGEGTRISIAFNLALPSGSER